MEQTVEEFFHDFRQENLVIACLACDSPAAGPRAVEVYRGLRMRRHPGAGRCAALDALRKAETFGDALEAYFANWAGLPPFAGLTLNLSRPVPFAELQAVDETGRVIWRFDWVVDVKLHAAGFYANETVGRPDKRITASFSENALLGLGLRVSGSSFEKDLPR